MSSNARFPDGLANSSGLMGRNLMVQTNQAVWGRFDEEIRWYKGPPSLALTEHWNYTDEGKDFFGGYAYMSQGPLPQQWASTQSGSHGLWGDALVRDMGYYIHQAGLKIVGEVLPQEGNTVSLADEKDKYGLPVARVTFSLCENDKKLVQHAIRHMTEVMRAAGGRDIWHEEDDTAHLNGTARMGDDPAAAS